MSEATNAQKKQEEQLKKLRSLILNTLKEAVEEQKRGVNDIISNLVSVAEEKRKDSVGAFATTIMNLLKTEDHNKLMVKLKDNFGMNQNQINLFINRANELELSGKQLGQEVKKVEQKITRVVDRTIKAAAKAEKHVLANSNRLSNKKLKSSLEHELKKLDISSRLNVDIDAPGDIKRLLTSWFYRLFWEGGYATQITEIGRRLADASTKRVRRNIINAGQGLTGMGSQLASLYRTVFIYQHQHTTGNETGGRNVASYSGGGIPSGLKDVDGFRYPKHITVGFQFGNIDELDGLTVTGKATGKTYPFWMIFEYGTFDKFMPTQGAGLSAAEYGGEESSDLFRGGKRSKTSGGEIKSRIKRRKKKAEYGPVYIKTVGFRMKKGIPYSGIAGHHVLSQERAVLMDQLNNVILALLQTLEQRAQSRFSEIAEKYNDGSLSDKQRLAPLQKTQNELRTGKFDFDVRMFGRIDLNATLKQEE